MTETREKGPSRREVLGGLAAAAASLAAEPGRAMAGPERPEHAEKAKEELIEEIRGLYQPILEKNFTIPNEKIEKEIGKWEDFLPEFLGNNNIHFNHVPFVGGFYARYRIDSNTIEIPYIKYSKDKLANYIFVGSGIGSDSEYLAKIVNGDWEGFSREELEKIREALVAFPGLNEIESRHFIDSIDHELCHAVLDDRNHGIIYSEDYEGPDARSLGKQVAADLKEGGVRAEKILKIARNDLSPEMIDAAVVEYGSLEGFMENFDFDIVNYRGILKKFELFFDMEKRNQVQMVGGHAEGNTVILDNPDLKEGIAEEARSILKGDYTVRELHDMFERGEMDFSLVSKGKDLGDMYLGNKDAGLIAVVLEDKIAFFYDRTFFEFAKEREMDTSELAKDYKRLLLQMAFEKILIEVNARKVDSLLSLSFHDRNYFAWDLTHFELCGRDLEIFETMQYKGKPVFGKAVEKYRLALRMREDGAYTRSLKNELQYAVEFGYQGEDYFWPETRIELPDIPILKEE